MFNQLTGKQLALLVTQITRLFIHYLSTSVILSSNLWQCAIVVESLVTTGDLFEWSRSCGNREREGTAVCLQEWGETGQQLVVVCWTGG